MSQQTHTPAPDEHSKVAGGSSAGALYNCGATRELCNLLPPGLSSSYADEGTMLHNALAHYLEGHVPYAEDLIGYTFEGEDGTTHALDKELFAEMVDPALDALEAIEDLYGDTFELMCERRVDFPGLPGAFGTSDLLGRGQANPKIGYCGDFKFGRGYQVDAGDNGRWQGLYYVTAAIATYPEYFEECEQFVFQIIQPAFGKGWSHTIFHREDIDTFQRNFVERINNPDGIPRAGSWCKFRRCNAICPLKTGPLQRIAEFEMKGSAVANIGEMLDLVELAEHAAVELKRIARDMIDAGHEIKDGESGWKIVAGKSMRRMKDEQPTVDLLTHDKIGLAHADVIKERTAPGVAGVGVIEKALRNKGFDARKIGDIMALITTRTEPKKLLVRGDHPGDSVTGGATAMRKLADAMKNNHSASTENVAPDGGT